VSESPELRAFAEGQQEQIDALKKANAELLAQLRVAESVVVKTPTDLKASQREAFRRAAAEYRTAVQRQNRERSIPDGILMMETAYQALVEMGMRMMALSRSEMFSGEQVAVLLGHMAEQFLRVDPESLVGVALGEPSLVEQKLGLSKETLSEMNEQRRAKARQESTAAKPPPLPPSVKLPGFLKRLLGE